MKAYSVVVWTLSILYMQFVMHMSCPLKTELHGKQLMSHVLAWIIQPFWKRVFFLIINISLQSTLTTIAYGAGPIKSDLGDK